MMRYRRTRLLAMSVTAILPTALGARAAAQSLEIGETRLYLEQIDSGGEAVKSAIVLSLHSYADAYSWTNEYLKKRGEAPLYCPPPEMVVTGEQTADIIRRFVRDNPSFSNGPLAWTVLKSFQKTFPC